MKCLSAASFRPSPIKVTKLSGGFEGPKLSCIARPYLCAIEELRFFASVPCCKVGPDAASPSLRRETENDDRGTEMTTEATESGEIQVPTLLIVEDDDLILEVIKVGLNDAGFEILVARNGTEALSELDADATRFKAIITDIRLGEGPDGWDVGRHARELVSDMPVVYISGDSGHEWPSKGVPTSVLIAKPFVIAQLITAVSTLVTTADTHRSSV